MTSKQGGLDYLSDFNFGFIDFVTYNNPNEKKIIENEVLPLAPQISTLYLTGVVQPDQTYPPALEKAISDRDTGTTKQLLKQYIIDIMDKFPNVQALDLVNKSRIPARPDDKLMQLLGEDYIVYVFQVARAHALNQRRDVKLLFSETANHYPGQYTNSTLYFAEKLSGRWLN